MNSRYLIVLILLVGFRLTGIAQKEEKIQKCIELFETDPHKAAKKLKKLLDKAGDEARYDAWDIYVEMKETTYNQKLNEVGESYSYFMIQTAYNRMGETLDSLQNAIPEEKWSTNMYIREVEDNMEALDRSAYDLYRTEYDEYLFALREASLKSKSIRSDGNLRIMFLEYDPDTMVVDSAHVMMYAAAYDELNNKQLKTAKEKLDELIQFFPESYNINMSFYLYYYYKNEMDSAKDYLKKTINLYPQQIEPRENLAKIYFGEGNIYRAKQQIEELMCLFPGQDMKGYYSEVLYVEDKKLVEQRVIRPIFPNQVGVYYPLKKNHWKDYQEAKLKVEPFSEPSGLIKKNDITDDRYLEVYSWKKMLEKNKDNKPKELEFAYKMQEKGLLDCYIFYSNYHIDFAIQAQEFTSSEENRERMKKFVKEYLVELAD